MIVKSLSGLDNTPRAEIALRVVSAIGINVVAYAAVVRGVDKLYSAIVAHRYRHGNVSNAFAAATA
jgi:hypothetical protein